MKREDCEKLLDVFVATALATRSIDTDAANKACESLDSLREVIVNIMENEKKPVYRDGGVVVRDAPIQWTDVTTIPAHVTKPIITCDGAGGIAVSAAYDLGRIEERKRQIDEEVVKTCL